MVTEYADFVNDSANYDSNAVLALYNGTLKTTTASTTATEGSTVVITAGSDTGAIQTVTIGDDVITFLGTGADADDAVALADALIDAGYTADGVTTAGTVSVVTDQEVLFTGDVATAVVSDNVALTDAEIASLLGSDSDVSNTINSENVNSVNGGSGDDVIALSSDATGTVDTVVWTGYNQGDDTIVNFDTTIDKLDFTSYLTGTVDANNSGSTSAGSEIDLTVTTRTDDTFTANSINLINFGDLDAVTATQTFEGLTTTQLEAALEADASANTVLTAAPGDLYQANGVSVLIIQDAANANVAVIGDTLNDATYKAYEVSYTDATVAAGATDFTVKLIGSFDLGDSAGSSALVFGDFVL